MRTNMVPLLTNLATVYQELRFAKNLLSKVSFLLTWSLRYIDNLFHLNKKAITDNESKQLIKQIYTLSRLKSVPRTVKDSLAIFLDLQILNLQHCNSFLVFRMYQKPRNTYQYLHYDSYITSSIKKRLVILEAQRIVSQFNNMIDCSKELAKF